MTDSDTDTDSASPSWDDLSFQRPAAPAVDGTVAPGTDPAVAAAINRMNQGLSAGQSDDEILSNEVGDIGRTGRKVTATTTGDDSSSKKSKSDGAPSWDSLSFSKPAPQPTMNQPDKSLMTQPDDEDDLVRASGGEQGTEPEDTTQGPGIGSVIASNLRGAGLSVARAGELAAAGIDQYLSPEDAEKEFKNAQALRDYQKENEVAPVTKGEKAASFASNLVGGLATGGIGGPESEAQDVIEEGGSVKDAEKALAVGTAQQEAMLGTGNLGKTLGTRLATQVPINVGLGAAARAVDGQDAGDSGDIASDIGSGVFGALVPGGEHETKEVKAARKVNEASDQLIKNTETSNADEIPQDQGGVSEAGTQPQSGGESRGEDLQQPAKAESGASDAGEQVDVDQNVQPPSASGDAEKGASDVGVSAKDESAPNAGETKPFTPEERSKEKTEAILDKVPGLSDEQKGYLRDNMPAPEKDSVTGYYTRPELKPTIDAAKDSGEPSAYAEVDLRNLGGLNAHVGSNSGADEHYTAMADIIRQEAEKSGAQVVPIRKGGDEMGLVFKGADANTAHQTMLNAQDRIADYATTNGLSDIANPKGGAKGTGIHFGVSDILPEHSTSDIIKRADTLVELRKKGETYEYPRPTEEVGTGERAAGRPGASTEASGVRDAGTDGLADDHEQATQGQRSSAAESGADDERAGESGAVEPEREAVPLYRTGTASEGVTAPEARDTLKKEFGSTAVRKMEAAGLKISPSSDLPKLSPELSPAERAGVKGVTAGGRPHLIHDQTSAAEIPGTVVHEIWHANADRVLPKTKQEALARAVDKVPGVQSALAKIPGSTNPAHVNAEKVAYALQHLHDNSVGTRALDAIKIGLNRLGVPKNWLDANESLLRRIGSENLKHFQETPRTYQDTGTERAAKPRIRVPVDQVPVSRTEDRATPTGAPTQRVTSIKNAQVNAEREERNAPLLESVKGASNKEAMDKAGEQLTKDPDLGRRLTAELLKSPRPLNKTEVAVMLRDRVRIHNELEDSYDEAHANPGDSGTIARIKDLEMQRDANDQADRLAGTENSLGLSARSMMANQDYSLVNMVKRLQVASGKSELPPETMKKVRAISDGLKALTPKRADNSPKAIKDEFESLKNELAGISAKPSSKPAGALYARAEPKVAEIIQRMAANRAAAGVPEDVAMNEIHAAVSPHADVSIKDVRDAVNDPKNANRQKFQDRKEAELGRRIQQGDFTKAQRYKPVYNEATLEREGKINALQKRFDALKRTEEQKNQSTAMKVGSTIHNAHIASILASLRVYPKLAGAVVAKYIGHGLEQATGALVQHLPGIRGIAAKADTQRVSLGGEAQYLKGIGKSFGEAKNTLMRGYSDIDAKYGGKDTITDEYTDYADKLFGGMGDAIKDGRYLDAARSATSGVARFEGRTHGAIKSFASTPKFYESYYNAAQKMMGDLRKSGMKEPEIQEYMSRRSTDLTLGTKAYLNSLEDKMQGKNALADGINRMLVSWDNSGNKGLQGLSLAFQTVFPIRKIPINIAKEVSSYAFGGIKALAASHGDMTGERADYIMKNIKKQGAGAALFALGYLAGPTMLGGVPQSGDAKKHLPVKPGEANIGGTEIGDSAFHSAVGQILQLGAGYRRAYGSYYGQSHNAVTAGLEALGDQYSSQLIRQVPYLDQPRRWMQTAEYAPRDKRSAVSEIVGNQLRSMVVPGVVQQAAQAQDSYKGWRKPKNILQDIETGIPGLRETVPTR